MLQDFYELFIETEDGTTVAVPWGFVRHLTGDRGFQEREGRRAEEGRAVLGKRIQRVRKSRGLSQSETARKSGVARVTLARVEKGEQSPTLDTIRKLAACLEVPVSELLTEYS